MTGATNGWVGIAISLLGQGFYEKFKGDVSAAVAPVVTA